MRRLTRIVSPAELPHCTWTHEWHAACDTPGPRACLPPPDAYRLENKKLVAEKGKLVEIIERSGVIPNGTGFAITTGPAPELDGKYLIVGRVVEGLALADEISKLPVVKDNSNSPFFKAGKAIGDKRAVVAEMGFNRPFNKVTVAASRLQ